MARLKTIRCPQCSGINPDKIAEGEYKCTYCGSLFHVEEKKSFTNVQDLFRSFSGNKTTHMQPGGGRMVKLITAIAVMGVLAGVGVSIFVATQATKTENKDGMVQESGWSAPSPDSKKYFVGSKGAVMWKMMKESGDRLDSARYTLLTIELKSGKRLSSQRWAKTMTWREGFDFGQHYYNRVFAIGDTVWVISDENRLNGYDMYTAKLLISAEKLEDMYKEFAPGISEANEVYNKPVMEVKTDDGFTYAFIPGAKKIMLREKFDNYCRENQSKKTFYVLNQGTRQALWKIRDEVNLYENQSSVGHWLGESQKANRGNYMITSSRLDILDSVPAGMLFYKAQVLRSTENDAVVVYRESMAKKSAAMIACVNGDGSIKWKTSLDQVKGLQDVFKNDQYIQYYPGKNELVIIHESGKLIGAGIDLNSGKINWTLYEE